MTVICAPAAAGRSGTRRDCSPLLPCEAASPGTACVSSAANEMTRMAATHSLDSHDGRPSGRTGPPTHSSPPHRCRGASGKATVSPVPVSVNQTGQWRQAPRRRRRPIWSRRSHGCRWPAAGAPSTQGRRGSAPVRPRTFPKSFVVRVAIRLRITFAGALEQHDGVEAVVEPSLVGHAARDVERPLAVGGQELDDPVFPPHPLAVAQLLPTGFVGVDDREAAQRELTKGDLRFARPRHARRRMLCTRRPPPGV